MDSDKRADEHRRREAAQAATAEVLDGREVPPRSLKQMLSLRLEPELLRDLRLFADAHGLSVSDVLRQAAVDFLDRVRRTPFVFTTRPIDTQQSINSTWSQESSTSSGTVATSNKQVA
ncbi:MAG TPA: hypothetical protein VMU94_05740 [Streptosporangiaceae bacterium]|nr:hypothetical protein [Streptosporangiaceae bacterium]